MSRSLVVFGLGITSSWNNGHATPYRGLLAALAARGWQIDFFERDVEWYRCRRDLADPPYCAVHLYETLAQAQALAAPLVRAADAVLVGSYAGFAQPLIDWLAAFDQPLLFYDIDTPITLTALRERGEAEYLRADQISRFAVYFSFTGGPALRELESRWGARRAEALYCAVDPALHRPVPPDPRFACALGYMGSYSADRQPKVEALLQEPARRLPDRRFLLAGALFPDEGRPPNIARVDFLPPGEHAAFYASGNATLNLTRAAMVRYGWSPSVRLFEAAACGACIISDVWPGLDAYFRPGAEMLFAESTADVVAHLTERTPEERAAIGAAARRRVLAEHTYERRAAQFEAAVEAVLKGRVGVSEGALAGP